VESVAEEGVAPTQVGWTFWGVAGGGRVKKRMVGQRVAGTRKDSALPLRETDRQKPSAESLLLNETVERTERRVCLLGRREDEGQKKTGEVFTCRERQEGEREGEWETV
jgi:hypothetical protein